MAKGTQTQLSKALQNSKTLRYFIPPMGEPGTCDLVRDDDAINEASQYFGLFASVSTMPCNAQTAIETYSNRDSIEKCFKAGKSDISLDTIRSHTDATMVGRLIVSFCALTILCELRRRMKTSFVETNSKGEECKTYTPLQNEMTFNAVLNYLDSIKIRYGKSRSEVRYEEVTEKQKLIAKRLGCQSVFDAVPEYAKG